MKELSIVERIRAGLIALGLVGAAMFIAAVSVDMFMTGGFLLLLSIVALAIAGVIATFAWQVAVTTWAGWAES